MQLVEELGGEETDDQKDLEKNKLSVGNRKRQKKDERERRKKDKKGEEEKESFNDSWR